MGLIDETNKLIESAQKNEAEYVDSAEYHVPGFKLPLSLDWLINNTKNLYTATNDLKINKRFKIYATIALEGDWLSIKFVCNQYQDFEFSGGFHNLLVKQMIATKQFSQAIKAWDKNSKAGGELIKYFTNASNYKLNTYSKNIAVASLRVKKDDTTITTDAHIKIDKKNFKNSDISQYIEPAVKNTHQNYDDDEIKEIIDFLVNNIKSGKLSKMVIQPNLKYYYVYKQKEIYDAHDMGVLMK